MIILPDEIIKNKLISSYVDINIQKQQAGIDLTVREVYKIVSAGKIDFDNAERVIASSQPLKFENDWVFLESGVYKVVFNEYVKIPLDTVAICLPRSTLVRNGCLLGTALWDPGYEGRSEVLLNVANPHGLYLKKNSRIAQLIFIKTERPVKQGYSGIYLKENV